MSDFTADPAASETNPFDAPAETLIETDYEIGQDNVETTLGPFPLDIHNPVFVISAGLVLAFVC